MKHWQETSQIVGRVTELAAAGRRAALATVVRIEGSAYRRPGAKLLVEESGLTRGGVSGGCLEADVREIAMTVMREGAPRLRHYETGGDDRTVWGLGLGCNGSVDVFVQPATSGDTPGRGAPRADASCGGCAVRRVHPRPRSLCRPGPDARGVGRPAGRLDGNSRPGSRDSPTRGSAPRGRRIEVLRHRFDHQRLHGGSRTAAAARHLRRRRRRDSPRGLCVTGRLPRDRRRSPSRLPVPRTLSGRGAHRPQTRRRPRRTAARSAHPHGGDDALVRPRPGVGQASASGPTLRTSAFSVRAPEKRKYSNR